ncbi:MarR family winged helix-turn-helix transcriptional regulator [Ohtaekwangia koreensis]|uniref:DNA-binding transcriptional regulator, MarR family n=1 Tax=Ohtaekwangia koreensis TaxID=688867 RepID=A0A1T5LP05_9BACT|nr:winged helix DNA-binding protein [Ohtaekwangia koreensis]SKC77723.1 DNA-binding transcriptional regulator, MarR family [Ohtaekwangia koreensis]
MNKTVELVNEWAKFESNHPEGGIADFCRYFLAHQSEKKIKGALVGGVVPDFTDGLLMKIIGRISKLNMFYVNMAFKDTEVNQIEEFGMLMTIRQNKNPRKTDVIYDNLYELSSGTDMLRRLQKRGLIKEYIDKNDKRSKRVELTPKGERTADQCYQQMVKNARMMTYDLADDDKKLVVQLLKGIEMKYSTLWLQHKNKSFSEVYTSITKIDGVVKDKSRK